jgi:hypothetical protein
VVVVDEVPLVVLVDCAKARPLDRANMADAIRSRFILLSCSRKCPFVQLTGDGRNGSLDQQV